MNEEIKDLKTFFEISKKTYKETPEGEKNNFSSTRDDEYNRKIFEMERMNIRPVVFGGIGARKVLSGEFIKTDNPKIEETKKIKYDSTKSNKFGGLGIRKLTFNE